MISSLLYPKLRKKRPNNGIKGDGIKPPRLMPSVEHHMPTPDNRVNILSNFVSGSASQRLDDSTNRKIKNRITNWLKKLLNPIGTN